MDNKYQQMRETLDGALEMWERNTNLRDHATLNVQAVQTMALIDIAESLSKIAGKSGVVYTKNANAE